MRRIKELEILLKNQFGYDSFRLGQKEIIQAILEKKDSLAIMPTGGGKSLCYELPALYLEGTAIVISPLISLMKDQVDELLAMGISAKSVHSYLSKEEEREILDDFLSGKLKLLYVSPERFSQSYFISKLNQAKLSFIAIDEAHCVSQWGHDFRPSYQKIKEAVSKLKEKVSLHAFTATATEEVKKDIISKLGLTSPFFFLGGFDRENLFFGLKKPSDKKKWLKENLSNASPTIIYCNTRKRTEDLYQYLKDNYFEVTYYHGGLSPEERSKNQDDFIFDRTPIIIATNAFGMGIDKSNVRKVIHYNMPQDIESYYQEAGRAGRDGARAEAILLFSAQDIMVSKFLIEKSPRPKAKENLEKMAGYAYTTTCLRSYILDYFGESKAECGNCSICKGDFEKTEMTKEAQMILSTISRTGQTYGASLIVDILKGSQNEKIKRASLDKVTTYGLLKTYKKSDIRDMISLLVYEGYLDIAGDDYPYLKLRAKSEEILFLDERLYINKMLQKASETYALTFDQALFERLKEVRLSIAENLEIAPYMVFSDKSLEEMARKKPTTNEAFLQIHGVGQKKLAQYGVPFMTVIKN